MSEHAHRSLPFEAAYLLRAPNPEPRRACPGLSLPEIERQRRELVPLLRD